MSLENTFQPSYKNGIATRKRILELIVAQPGIHLRAIVDELGIRHGSAQYNLERMKREKIVEYKTEGQYRRYYALREDLPQQAYPIKGTALRVAEAARSNPKATKTDIANLLGVSWQVAHYHIKTLKHAGVLQ